MPVAEEGAGQEPRRSLPDRLRVRGGPARVAEGARDHRLLAERPRRAGGPRGAHPPAGGDDGDERAGRRWDGRARARPAPDSRRAQAHARPHARRRQDGGRDRADAAAGADAGPADSTAVARAGACPAGGAAEHPAVGGDGHGTRGRGRRGLPRVEEPAAAARGGRGRDPDHHAAVSHDAGHAGADADAAPRHRRARAGVRRGGRQGGRVRQAGTVGVRFRQLRQGGGGRAGGAARGRRERAREEAPGAGPGRAESRRPGAHGRRRARQGGHRGRRCGRGRSLHGTAPWDKGAVGLQRRIAEAKAQAQRDADAKLASARTAQLTAALNEAGTALQAKQYEAAIAAYDRALQLDPGNAAAQTGRAAAIGAKSLADAAGSGPRSGGPVKSFVQGRTEAKAAQSKGMAGFDETAGVPVHQGTAAASLPGTVVFEATPQVPKPGEGFKVSVYLSNEGAQPIPLAPMMTVSTTLDGRLQRGRSRRPPPPSRRGSAGSCTRRRPAWCEGQHAVVGDGGRRHHPAQRDLPQHAHLEVAGAPSLR